MPYNLSKLLYKCSFIFYLFFILSFLEELTMLLESQIQLLKMSLDGFAMECFMACDQCPKRMSVSINVNFSEQE